MELTEKQQAVIGLCSEPRTSAEICNILGVTRWYIYTLCRRGLLKNVATNHNAAKYVASRSAPPPKKPRPKPQWTVDSAIIQASSVWHYAQRLK